MDFHKEESSARFNFLHRLTKGAGIDLLREHVSYSTFGDFFGNFLSK
jgi:hypothetical protein